MTEQQKMGETLAYLSIFAFQLLFVVAFALAVSAWERYKKRMHPLDTEAAEVERLRRDEKTRSILKKNLVFVFGAGFILLGHYCVPSHVGKTFLFGFGVAAISGAFVWQVAAKD